METDEVSRQQMHKDVSMQHIHEGVQKISFAFSLQNPPLIQLAVLYGLCHEEHLYTVLLQLTAHVPRRALRLSSGSLTSAHRPQPLCKLPKPEEPAPPQCRTCCAASPLPALLNPAQPQAIHHSNKPKGLAEHCHRKMDLSVVLCGQPPGRFPAPFCLCQRLKHRRWEAERKQSG